MSTGQQMVILYLGIVGGGTFLLSCVCTTFWVAVNSRRRRRRSSPEDLEDEELADDSSSEGEREHEMMTLEKTIITMTEMIMTYLLREEEV
ncbi:hypothetical protein PoB_001196800 [Plakobranchus ocellatus]|uniref:Transmembrane protein n=1 Tax=Plakobranchus ocellatus TaxID=259542 RepID=A0AAV3YT72_9GAST|nr:hypothetical protein PoB_001196800 [Plakobranchus ocellatus]